MRMDGLQIVMGNITFDTQMLNRKQGSILDKAPGMNWSLIALAINSCRASIIFI